MSVMSLDEIYTFLAPIGVSVSNASSNVTPERLPQLISNTALDPTGKFVSFDTIKKKIETYLEGASPDALKLYETSYQIIGKTGPVKFSDEGLKYWTVKHNGSDVQFNNSLQLVTDQTEEKLAKPGFQLSVFSSRDPFVSPATRGTKDISKFLNYMPGIIFSQVTPYLDLQFILEDPSGGKALSKPSTMRFLLGSVDVESLKSPADKALAQGSSMRASEQARSAQLTSLSASFGVAVDPKSVPIPTQGVSGMEMFLAPQTMVDLEQLNYVTNTRPVKPKPFVPFASIESFDVKVQNAGAGKFASKRATLKFRIHDKARLSEFSEFVRGGNGYRQATIWTTYGWIAPRFSDSDGVTNEYFKFINSRLMTRDAWRVINSQFSLDQTGQVTFTLDMMTAAGVGIQNAKITTAGGSGFDSNMASMKKALETVSALKEKYLQESPFASDMQMTQVINAVSETANFSELKDVDLNKSLNKLIAAAKAGGMTDQEAKDFFDASNKLKNKYNYDNVNSWAANAAATMMKNFGKTADPFLPDEGRQALFFSEPWLVPAINAASGLSRQFRENDKPKEKEPVISLGSAPAIVSFGKLFIDLVVPAVIDEGECDELQIFFYSLNDNCGPISGHSVAEFPVEIDTLSYAYFERLKLLNSSTMTVQEFLNLVMNSQFSNTRAPGYGMTTYYGPLDKTKPSEVTQPAKELAEASEAGLIKWFQRYGSLKNPSIEMFIESGLEVPENGLEDGSSPDDIIKTLKSGTYMKAQTGNGAKMIKRIHIYDKACNPHAAAQAVFDAGNGNPQIGRIRSEELNKAIKTYVQKASATNAQFVQELSNALKNREGKSFSDVLSETAKKLGIADIPPDLSSELTYVDKAGVTGALVPRDNANYRRQLKHELSKHVPTIIPGTNGSLVQNITMASKTDGALAAMQIAQAYKNEKNGFQPVLVANGAADPSGLPLKTIPVQMTMTTAGVPTALLYQTYFVDMDTGTTMDNIYTCTGLQHNIAKGKFTTQWTFTYSNGYGKYEAPPSVAIVALKQGEAIVAEALEAAKPKEEGKPAGATGATPETKPAGNRKT